MSDELTGLYNRREMNGILQKEISRCKRYDPALSSILIDVDGFKSINDTFGHLEGDEVLRSIAQLLSEKLRSSDSMQDTVETNLL